MKRHPERRRQVADYRKRVIYKEWQEVIFISAIKKYGPTKKEVQAG